MQPGFTTSIDKGKDATRGLLPFHEVLHMTFMRPFYEVNILKISKRGTSPVTTSRCATCDGCDHKTL